MAAVAVWGRLLAMGAEALHTRLLRAHGTVEHLVLGGLRDDLSIGHHEREECTGMVGSTSDPAGSNRDQITLWLPVIGVAAGQLPMGETWLCANHVLMGAPAVDIRSKPSPTSSPTCDTDQTKALLRILVMSKDLFGSLATPEAISRYSCVWAGAGAS
jgi:hypothetical protein